MKLMKKLICLSAQKTADKKKIKGFTLIELIIVIAIIGILAAILIPTMTGKVREAKINKANDSAAKVAELASVAMSELDAKGTPIVISSENSFFSAEAIGISALLDAEAEKLQSAVEGAMPALKATKNHWAVLFNADGGIKAALYWEDGSKYVGGYPCAFEYNNNNSIDPALFGNDTALGTAFYKAINGKLSG